MNLANMQNQDWPKNRRTRRKMAMTLYEQKMATIKVVHQFSRVDRENSSGGKMAMGVQKSKWARAKIWNQWVRINLGEFQYPPQAPTAFTILWPWTAWADTTTISLNCFAALVPIFSQWYNSFSVGPLLSPPLCVWDLRWFTNPIILLLLPQSHHSSSNDPITHHHYCDTAQPLASSHLHYHPHTQHNVNSNLFI